MWILHLKILSIIIKSWISVLKLLLNWLTSKTVQNRHGRVGRYIIYIHYIHYTLQIYRVLIRRVRFVCDGPPCIRNRFSRRTLLWLRRRFLYFTYLIDIKIISINLSNRALCLFWFESTCRTGSPSGSAPWQ